MSEIVRQIRKRHNAPRWIGTQFKGLGWVKQQVVNLQHFNIHKKYSGEKLSDDEVAEVFADCMDPEDEDGNIFYARKLSLHNH